MGQNWSLGMSSEGASWGCKMLLKIPASCLRDAIWLSLVGESGDAGLGFWRAWMRSLAAAVAASVEEAVGIFVLEGNHDKVSEILSAEVSLIQTL